MDPSEEPIDWREVICAERKSSHYKRLYQ